LTIKNSPPVPIPTLHLFPVLDKLLIELLKSLTPDEWNLPTIARQWTVKDISAHLLDGNLRSLSASRDNYFVQRDVNFASYGDLVMYLNQLNHEWTHAAKRLSPQIIIYLLELSGKQYVEHLNSLDPFSKAIYSVAWAGQDVSENWFHIAREYTEKFLHQQQIRDAVGLPGLMTKQLFLPFMDIMMFGMLPAFKDVAAENGTSISIVISSEIGSCWNLYRKNDSWCFKKDPDKQPDAILEIEPDLAWKLFSKGISPAEALPKVKISGDIALAKYALKMVSVMA